MDWLLEERLPREEPLSLDCESVRRLDRDRREREQERRRERERCDDENQTDDGESESGSGSESGSDESENESENGSAKTVRKLGLASARARALPLNNQDKKHRALTHAHKVQYDGLGIDVGHAARGMDPDGGDVDGEDARPVDAQREGGVDGARGGDGGLGERADGERDDGGGEQEGERVLIALGSPVRARRSISMSLLAVTHLQIPSRRQRQSVCAGW